MDNIILKLEQLTKMSYEAQNQILRSFIRTDVEIKLQIIQHQKQLFHKIKNIQSNTDNSILTLASLILAIDFVVGKVDDVNLNAIKLRGNNNKAKIKRQKVLGYWAIIRTLKLEQNMSFREIATYFVKYHKFDISYSTIYELWNQLEKNTKNQDN